MVPETYVPSDDGGGSIAIRAAPAGSTVVAKVKRSGVGVGVSVGDGGTTVAVGWGVEIGTGVAVGGGTGVGEAVVGREAAGAIAIDGVSDGVGDGARASGLPIALEKPSGAGFREQPKATRARTPRATPATMARMGNRAFTWALRKAGTASARHWRDVLL
jgi:hypothetical protein